MPPRTPKRSVFYVIAAILVVINVAVFFGYSGAFRHYPTIPPDNYTSGWGNDEKILKSKTITISSPVSEFKLKPEELKNWFELYHRSYTDKEEYRPNQEKIKFYLENLSKKISRSPINARLIIEDGRAQEFAAPQRGFTLDVEKSLSNVLTSLAKNRKASISFVELATIETEPGVTLEKINSLGINTLLGRGESDFTGSPKHRAHNINIGAGVFTGIILKPGEQFSFNTSLGPVDASTGYLPELVIKEGKLIPEYGGGLCQVSTTLFRAAVYAGLPIKERRPHSLPVRYYNPQGFDATIYPGVSDLKFTNDTPAHILIQAKVVGSKLYFEIYGTSDNRHTIVDGPRQYDVQANGALKALLNRTVIYADGTEKKDEFRSSYKSPSLFPTVRDPFE